MQNSSTSSSTRDSSFLPDASSATAASPESPHGAAAASSPRRNAKSTLVRRASGAFHDHEEAGRPPASPPHFGGGSTTDASQRAEEASFMMNSLGTNNNPRTAATSRTTNAALNGAPRVGTGGAFASTSNGDSATHETYFRSSHGDSHGAALSASASTGLHREGGASPAASKNLIYSKAHVSRNFHNASSSSGGAFFDAASPVLHPGGNHMSSQTGRFPREVGAAPAANAAMSPQQQQLRQPRGDEEMDDSHERMPLQGGVVDSSRQRRKAAIDSTATPRDMDNNDGADSRHLGTAAEAARAAVKNRDLEGGGGGGGAQSSSVYLPETKPQNTSVITQLIATIRRQLIQKRRGWLITIMEIILPAIFTLILVIVAHVEPPQKYEPRIYSSQEEPRTVALVRAMACYNGNTAPELMSLIRPCSEITGETIRCAKPGIIPVDNFCVVGGEDSVEDVVNLISQFEEELEVPNLDDMILLKWIVRAMVPPTTVFWDGMWGLGTAYSSLQNYGSIFFMPENTETQIIRNVFHNRYTLFKYVWGGFFPDRGAAEGFVKNIDNEGRTWAFVELREVSERNLDFVIMTNRSGVPWMNLGPRELYSAGLASRGYGSFYSNGFLSIQKAVNDYYLKDVLGVNAADISPDGANTHLTMQPMGLMKHKFSSFLQLSLLVGPLVLVLAFLFPISQLAKRLVEEKEQRLREATMIMGLTKTAFFSSWILIYYVQMILAALLVSFVQKMAITTETNFGIIFLMYLLFVIATINMAAMLSCFFSRAKTASLLVPLLYFVVSIPAFALPDGTSPVAYHVLSIFCPTPLAVALRLEFGYEVNRGLGFSDFMNDLDKPYRFGDALIWTVADAVIYLILLVYFDYVVPKEWGTTLHPLFFLKSKRTGGIWPGCDALSRGIDRFTACILCRKYNPSQRLPDGEDEELEALNEIDNPANHMKAEQYRHNAVQDYPMTNRESSVSILRLRKEFVMSKKETNVAVDDLCLRMFPDGITVLLGHNGAGKTTVMNMMTGMMPPTSGDVRIYGKSIVHDMQAIRRDIGFCPQHNILWDDLTCLEHLQYFARLKGMHGGDVNNEAREMLARVDLVDKADVLSCNLSGGQKRKLSVAIAFMGRARLVLLDEPTAGMDVAARRHTWDVLKDMSQNRTILLTTHYMDEADLLGSSVAIMSRGSLHSYGTPMYLKNNLGTGYVMRIALVEPIEGPDALLAEVRGVIPTAELRELKGQEISFSLPRDEAKNFPAIIRHMEAREVRNKHGVISVSMAVATLEDVFLSIAHEEDRGKQSEEEFEAGELAERESAFAALEDCYTELRKNNSKFPTECAANAPMSSSVSGGETGRTQAQRAADEAAAAAPPTQFQCLRRQLKGLLMKRFNHARRDYFTLGIQIVSPILCIVFAMGLTLLDMPVPPLHYMDNSAYGLPQTMDTNNCDKLQPYWSRSFDEVKQHNLPTSYDFANYLLQTYDTHPMERYISMACENTFGNNVLYVNATSLQSGPQSVNEFYQARARESTTDSTLSMQVASWPLPYTNRESAQVSGIKALLASLFVLIPFSFIPSVFTSFVVRERECKSKHLQFVTGANFVVYWLANFIFDICSFFMTVAIAFVIFGCFVRNEYVGSVDRFFATFFLFFFYGLSTLGLAYFVSYFFKTHSTAQTVTLLVCFLSGFILVVLIFFLENLARGTKDVADVLVYFFRIIPPFCLGDGLKNLSFSYSMDKYNGGTDPWAMKVVGWNMLYMAFESVIFFICAIIVDHPLRHEKKRKLQFKSTLVAPFVPYEDEDVLNERKEIEGDDPSRESDVVKVKKIRKVFTLGSNKFKTAVENISFGVKKGEVFGFLGTNGAGKTTTMSMLTTEIAPTCGQGFIGGFDVVSNSDKTRELIGYCPQFDAIMDLLTPVEHLELFASLRLIPVASTERVIDALIKACALNKYRDVPAGKLSGGNKRKLSVAMSLVGAPSIVMLDEPSAGMDPSARRQLWDVISFVAKHSSVLLTTHHLEEVDVLAHRVGIMDAGLMRCLGTLESLKHKFGNGYELTIQVDSMEGAEAAVEFLFQQYPDAVLVEARQQRMIFTLPFDSTDLASLFQTVQEASEDPATGIVDYIVQQTSLEQVFMRISAMKRSEDEEDRGAMVEGQNEHDDGAAFEQDHEQMSQHVENDPFADDFGSPMGPAGAAGFNSPSSSRRQPVLPHDPDEISGQTNLAQSGMAGARMGQSASRGMSFSNRASAVYAGAVFNRNGMMSGSMALRQSMQMQFRSGSAALHASLGFNNPNNNNANANASRGFNVSRGLNLPSSRNADAATARPRQ